MKRFLSLLIIHFAFVAAFAQTSAVKTAPENRTAVNSKIVDAKQLLQDLETLSADAFEGRGIGTNGGIKAREYVAKRFKESGIKAFKDSYFQPFEFTSRNGSKINAANVIGFVEGKKFKDKFMVVSAHYDHLGNRNGEIYNGADDNASGTSALFALADYFSKNKPFHTIIFAAFDGEESGFRGSRQFLDAPPVAKESIRLNINMDMVAHNDKNELYAAGTYHYPNLKPTLELIAKQSKIKLLLGHDNPELKRNDWTNQSDHFVFHHAKIPFVYFGVEDHKDYHRPTDDFENINQEFYVRAVETILEAVKGFDKDLK